MKKDKIDKLFARLKAGFDTKNPPTQHRERFLEKLKSEKLAPSKKSGLVRYLKPVAAVAAGLVLLFSLAWGFYSQTTPNGLAGVSPKMAQTQDFYSTAIANQLREINKNKSPQTQSLVEDAMTQMHKLEKEYAQLKKDLAASGDDKRVIFAMIANFQNRINLLQNLMQQIEEIKHSKQKNHEKPTTV